MTQTTPPIASARALLDVAGTPVTIDRCGSGPPVVLVHGEDGALFLDPFLDALARHVEVHLLHLPGWGVTPHTPAFEGIDDLALLLLDVLALTSDAPMPVVGLSIGAWVAAHAASLVDDRFERLALVAPVGLKTVGRDERAFVDIWASAPEALRAARYGDLSRAPDLTQLDDAGFLQLAHAHEAVARHGWEPYLHDPKLGRRLARVRTSTLVVTGAADRFVLEPDYATRWVERLGGPARELRIAGAGHRVEEEAPGELAAVLTDFLTA